MRDRTVVPIRADIRLEMVSEEPGIPEQLAASIAMEQRQGCQTFTPAEYRAVVRMAARSFPGLEITFLRPATGTGNPNLADVETIVVLQGLPEVFLAHRVISAEMIPTLPKRVWRHSCLLEGGAEIVNRIRGGRLSVFVRVYHLRPSRSDPRREIFLFPHDSPLNAFRAPAIRGLVAASPARRPFLRLVVDNSLSE